MIAAAELETAFPEVNPGEWPVGPRVLVQFVTVRERTAGGIVLPEETREVNKSLTQIAKVRAVGQIAFCSRDTGYHWPEGVWCKVGDVVRVPKYTGHRFSREIPGTGDKANFAIIEDHQIGSVIDPTQFANVTELL